MASPDPDLRRPCPDCANVVVLKFDCGSPGHGEEPPTPAQAYCPACGQDFELDDDDWDYIERQGIWEEEPGDTDRDMADHEGWGL